MLVRVDFKSRRCPLPCPLPVRPARNPSAAALLLTGVAVIQDKRTGAITDTTCLEAHQPGRGTHRKSRLEERRDNHALPSHCRPSVVTGPVTGRSAMARPTAAPLRDP